MRITEETLERISARDDTIGAFRRVRAQEALSEARAVGARPDLADLPLAGVPIAVKDVVAVAGEYAEWGSRAGSRQVAGADGEIVARLRAAGAVVVGLSRVPELCSWASTDTAEGIARNPAAPEYVAGGSSGGSAAAVAAGMVPLAHGTDALGSIRGPAAICGVLGIMPGAGVVPASDSGLFCGLYRHGALATTAADAALLLAVLAQRPDLGRITEPGALRVAVSTRVPVTGAPVPKGMTAAVTQVAKLLRVAGHSITAATPRYGTAALTGAATRWFAGPAEHAAEFDPERLQPRTRTHVRIGRFVDRAGLVREGPRREWIARAGEFFTRARRAPHSRAGGAAGEGAAVEPEVVARQPAAGGGQRVSHALEPRGLPGSLRACRPVSLRSADRCAAGGPARRRAAVARPRRAAGEAQGPVTSSVSSPAMAR